MLKNYFITAINNLIKNKLYSAINIVGLAIGLSACLIIALYVMDQYSYDKQWKDSDKIYRVNYSVQLPGKERMKYALASLPVMPALQEYFKDKIEQIARTFEGFGGTVVIDTGTTKFRDRMVSVDPSFIEMFQFKVLAGSLEDTLADRNNIALSEIAARRHFGNQDPIGKMITIDLGSNFKVDKKVTAVYRIPGNTVLDDIPLLGLLDDTNLPPALTHWFNTISGTYFKLKKGIDIETLRSLTPAFIDRNIDISRFISDPTKKASDFISLDFQRLDTAHLDSPWDVERAGGNKAVVMSFAGISLLILLIGCINFTILTTAKATQRAREVAMRKVAGAKRKQLIIQFIGESTFIVFLSMILSIGVVEIMLPVFESIVGKSFSLNYTSPSTFLPLLALLLIVGISGGLYPAFVLSGFRPGDTLKANQSKETRGSISLRQVLVIFQFSVSIILIISTGVIYAQIKYSMNRDPGYDKNNLLVIDGLASNEKIRGKIDVLKQELLNLADISDVSVSEFQPSHQMESNYAPFTLPGHPETTYMKARMYIDDDYFKTYRIPIITGRDFSMDRDLSEPKFNVMTSDMSGRESTEILERNAVINESAVREFGFTSAEDAVGKVISITLNNINYTIIGVVADNHLFSINAPPRTEVYMLNLLNQFATNVMTVRFKGSPKKILTQVKSVWKNVAGDEEISTVFVDQLVAREFKQEKTEENIIVSFSILAILIACMGLFGSASFTVEKRTKEIGLRKVMGAKVKNIVSLLLWQFSKPVLMATIIAWPVAIFVMQYWLERFTYRFNSLLMIPICLVSGLIALAIAWFTVAGNTTRVAKSRPIKALRYE
ncbi:MAG: ABC transporter permease [Desulfobacteraceae bacterium]|jgi:putative ABC transport system permease protein